MDVIDTLEDHQKEIELLFSRLEMLEDIVTMLNAHKNCQIDENRKISRVLDDLLLQRKDGSEGYKEDSVHYKYCI